MRDAGEPLSRGQADRPAAEARGRRAAIFFAVLLTGAVLVNGILAILFIALVQALGLSGPAAGEAASLDEVRSSLQAVLHRSSATVA
jgi:hypothetical protein